MPPRKRNTENQGLPARWRHYHGAYYYHVPPGMEHRWEGKRQFRLGKTLAEAYKTWSERLELHQEARTIGDLLDRYLHEVIPGKAPKTQAGNRDGIRQLKPVFAHMPIKSLRPVHAYQYLDKRGKKARTAANREIEVLSHAYTKAIEWGLTEHHPIKGKVRKLTTPPRDRYVENWEVLEALTVAPPMLHAYIRTKLLTGLRRGDLLRLRIHDLRDDGIHVKPHKTAHTSGKRLIISWSPELIAAINDAKQARKKITSMWLFSTRLGQPYIKEDGSANAFDSLWQRFIRKVLKDTKVEARFTEHDLRAKVGSDADSLERARQLLAHASASTTQRIYRRKPEVIKPLK